MGPKDHITSLVLWPRTTGIPESVGWYDLCVYAVFGVPSQGWYQPIQESTALPELALRNGIEGSTNLAGPRLARAYRALLPDCQGQKTKSLHDRSHGLPKGFHCSTY